MKTQFFFQGYLVFIVGCSLLGPKSILDELVCEPPCWQSIIPGKTSRDEVKSLIYEMENIVTGSIFDLSPDSSHYHNKIGFDIENNGELIDVEINFIGNIVSHIVLYLNLGVDIENAINVFGKPKMVYVNSYPTARTYLINEELGVYYVTEKRSYISSNDELTPDTEVILITFFDNSVFTQWIEEGHFTDEWLKGEEFLARMYPWNGYGDVTEKYMP